VPEVASRLLRSTVGPLAIYGLVSVAFFGRPLLRHGDRDYVGLLSDPQIFIWSLGWWPHAILNGDNPFVTHAVWPVVGVNLAWVTAVPGIALLAAPVTLLAGPVIAYNVVAVVLPALTAWTAFLLCRYLTRAWWPSLGGGFLFGFSSYVVGHTTAGHSNLTSVFLVPLVALTMLKYAHGRIGRRAVALRLGLLFGAQVYLSTEIFATLTVSLVTSLVVAFIVVAEARTRLRSAVPALLGAYVIGCVVAAPLLWYALTDFRTGSIVDPSLFPADLLNVVVPTEATFLSGDRASALSQDFRGNLAENGAYLGLPLLAVLGWFTWARRREPGARLLVVLIALGVVAELGLALHVGGDRIIALPWALAAKLPALGIVLPVRFTMYVALGVAVAAALWAASPRPSWWVRTALVAAAAISLLPAVSRDLWSTTPARVAFFTDELYRTCLRPNESVLIPSAAFMDATLWQVESDFRFRLASGYLGSDFPEGVPHEDVAFDVLYSNVPEGGGAAVLRLARGLGATTILVDAEHVDLWRPVLAEAGLEPVANGGVWLYHLGPVPPACRG
jgi:hypothetical protein